MAEKPQILLIDDDPELCQLMGSICPMKGLISVSRTVLKKHYRVYRRALTAC